MIRRVTTNGTMYSYRSTLQRTYRKLNGASDKVISNRSFTSYAEDPAAATRAFQLRRTRWNTQSQLRNNSNITGKFSQGWDALEKVYNDLGNEIDQFDILRGSSDSTASGRKALGQSMIATADSILLTMNSKYGDEYIFAAADGLNAPFSWGDNGELLYRGYNVDADPNDPDLQPQKAVMETGTVADSVFDNYAADPTNNFLQVLGGFGVKVDVTKSHKEQLEEYIEEFNKACPHNANWTASLNAAGDGIDLTANNPQKIDDTWQLPGTTITNYGKDADTDAIQAAQEAIDAIKSMLQETTFEDLGMGMEEGEDGKIKPATAFNSALCGLKYLGGDSNTQDVYGGYGVDEDGDPMNFISLIKKAGELLYNTDESSGAWEEVSGREDIDRLINKIHNTLGKVSVTHVDLDTDVAFLKTNNDRLTQLDDTLNDQIVEEEDLDPAEAITSLMWAQYSYSAALKIGNSILSQSLLDYLS